MRAYLGLCGFIMLCGWSVFVEAGPAVAADLAAADRAAAFKAAGFTDKGGRYVRCEDDVTASYQPGRIEVADLNKDGRPEAWITESSLFCYGNTAEAVVLVTKTASGAWTPILNEVGVALERDTRHGGWPDIEVGGPGAGPFPVFQFDGAKYGARR